MGVEVEAKLVAPTREALLSLPGVLAELGWGVGEPETVIALDHYLDSADLHLRQAGWALRLRDLGTRKLLTMKALRPADGGLAARAEHEEAIDWDGRGGWNLAPVVLEGRAHRILDGARLEELFSLRQDRVVLAVGSEEGLWAELSLDSVRWEAEDGYVEAAFEAELELRKGSEEQLRELLAAAAAATGWPAGGRSKYERGLEVAGLA